MPDGKQQCWDLDSNGQVPEPVVSLCAVLPLAYTFSCRLSHLPQAS